MDTIWTLGEVAKLLDLSRATIRNWSGQNGEFAMYLSTKARPEKGEVREFTYEDLKVFWFISQCRQKGLGYPDIHTQLQQGNHLSLEMTLDLTPSDPEDDEETTAELRGLIRALEEERDWLREEVARTRAEVVAAERRAAEAETKMTLLGKQ
jgi:DNA-binding transcriptional MerR regulator